MGVVMLVGASKPTVIGQRNCYVDECIAGLEDLPKSGRPTVIDDVAVVLATLRCRRSGSG